MNRWLLLLVNAALCGSAVAGCAPLAQHTATPARQQARARDTSRQRAAPQPPLGRGIQDVRLLVEPDDSKRRLTRPIRDAQRSIDLTMYLLTDHTLIHDLEYAAASGARVR